MREKFRLFVTGFTGSIYSQKWTRSGYVEVTDTVTPLDDERYRLYTAVESKSTDLMSIVLGIVRRNILALVLFAETRGKRDVENAVF